MPRLRVALVALAILTVALAAHAEDAKFVARVGSVAPEGTPWAMWLNNVRKDINKDSGGAVKLKVFLAGKLGGEKEMVEQTKKGQLQMFGGSAGALASKYVPELNVLELPFIFASDAEADYVLNAIRPDVDKLLDERGFKFVMWAENGWHGYGVKGKCLTGPDDMAGLKMRSQESTVHIETYKAFGASPVEMPVPEVLSSLQTGVVDGYSNTPLFSFATSWYKGIDHFTYTRHVYQPGLIVLSKKWYATLDDTSKKAVMSTKREREGINGVRQLTQPLLDNFKAANVKVCKLDDAGIKAFQVKAKPVWDAFAKKSKGNKKIFDAVMKAKAAFAKQ
jgi:TRAP-type C4-dicarboxylate transport system substrate-binding protein